MSNELLSSKIVVEEEAPTVRGIPSAPTSVAGAIGLTQRGPIGEAILCSSFDEYERRFGGFTTNSDVALAAAGFFENGGSALWVVRTVHYSDVARPETATATRATANLVTGTATPPALPTAVLQIEGKDPGVYASRIEIEVRAASNGDAASFNMHVIEDGIYREAFPNLTMDPAGTRYVERVVNDPQTGSLLVRATDQKVASHPLPNIQTVRLIGGGDGLVGLADTDFVGSDVGKTGLYALDRVQDLSLLIVPGRATPAVHSAMLSYAEVWRDKTVFAILDPPANLSATDIVSYVTGTASLEEHSEFGAIYWPRVEVLNPARSVFGTADRIVVPPSGILAGVYARTDSAHSGGIYDPPAGIETGRMFGVLGFESLEVLEERKRDLIYPRRINPLTTRSGLARFVDGSRTLKSSGNFPYVSQRRGVSFIERSVKLGLEFARHRNNTESLRAQVRRTIRAFLITQMNLGAFASTNPDTAFFIDLSLNTQAVIFSGKLIVRIGVALNTPAEFLILRFSQDTRALDQELEGAS